MEERWNFLLLCLHFVAPLRFVLLLSFGVLCSIFLNIFRFLHPPSVLHNIHLFIHPTIRTHTHTRAHTGVCVLTHNPRQFLLLFKGISSESNHITEDGGLNSFWNPTLFYLVWWGLSTGIKERGALCWPALANQSIPSMDCPVWVLHKYLAALNGNSI